MHDASLCRRDLKAASDILGSQPYLFGEQPCLADATLFAFVNCFVTLPDNSRSEIRRYLIGDASNLVAHFDRMRRKYWPDFDECLSQQ